MHPETAAVYAVLAALLLMAARAIRRLQARLAQAERETESARDAAWEAQEREERVRADGERALAGALERAESGARAKSRFLATVTHEMRTPLSGVLGAADLLLDTTLAPDQRTYARAIKTSADGMLSLVDDILDLSRIEADRVAVQNAPFDVAEVAQGVAELLAPRAQAKGLDFAVRIAACAPGILTGDAARIRQILLNLAGNAVKFTASGGVGLRVSASGGAVRFAVHDTGPGFDPSDAERLFGEFEQGAPQTAAGGVGLGLAISRRLAAAMGGAVTGDAKRGGGAVFTLTLPALGPPSGIVAPPAAAPLTGRSIAVASAAPFGGPWLVEQLREWGAAAGLAPFGSPEALAQKVAASAADTVLIDRAAPGRVADLATAARMGGATTVLVLLSPADRHELASLKADGFDGYLVKPIRAESMISRLNDPRGAGVGAAPDAPATYPQAAAEGIKVLLAEDDPVSALIALAHLRRLGHSTTQVGDGLSACAAFAAERFDAVLLDVRMPGLDGLTAARRMRTAESSDGRAPALLLALTANVSMDDRAAALAAGMDDLLAKPLDPVVLEALLAGCARASRRVA